jgi:aminopeptidase N
LFRRGLFTFLLLLLCTPAFAQRLPADVIPGHYDITVTPNLQDATFSGTERIVVDLKKPSTAIVLNSAEIEFDKVTVKSGNHTAQARVTLDASKEQATFTVDRPLAVGPAEIVIAYRGILNDQLRGLYLSKGKNRRYAVTQLEATDARRMFPSFDEPAFKATFTLTAIIDNGDHAISNGAIVSDTPGPATGKHTVKFETSPKMSTYLLALVVGDFECESGSADGVPIRVCATPDKKGQTGLALEAAEEILRYYDKYYSVKYPFKKLDVVAVPDFAAGAMENTAAIFYRETLQGNRRRPRARDGASMVRRSRDHEVVGRHLAERRVCHVDGNEAGESVEAGVARRARRGAIQSASNDGRFVEDDTTHSRGSVDAR